MPNAKFIKAADWASAPEIDVTEGENLFPQLPAGTYRPVLSGVASVVVPALTAGAIVQTTPTVGDTLTVTGSNATGTATFQWQDSSDNSTWADVSGATSATLDTSSITGADYVRRGVSDGVQGPAYTASVQVAAVAPSGPSVNTVAVVFSDGVLDMSISATGYADDDSLAWSLVPTAGGAAVASGTFTWPAATLIIPDGLTETSYRLIVAGVASNPFDLVYPIVVAPTVPPAYIAGSIAGSQILGSTNLSSISVNLNMTNYIAGRDVLVMLAVTATADISALTVTLNGVSASATEFAGGVDPGGCPFVGYARFPASAFATTSALVIDSGSDVVMRDIGGAAFVIDTAATLVAFGTPIEASTTSPLTFSGTAQTDDTILAAVLGQNSTPWSWTEEVAEVDIRSSEMFAVASKTVTATGGETISASRVSALSASGIAVIVR